MRNSAHKIGRFRLKTLKVELKYDLYVCSVFRGGDRVRPTKKSFWFKVLGSGPSGVGLRGFESRPPHQWFLEDFKGELYFGFSNR